MYNFRLGSHCVLPLPLEWKTRMDAAASKQYARVARWLLHGQLREPHANVQRGDGGTQTLEWEGAGKMAGTQPAFARYFVDFIPPLSLSLSIRLLQQL